MSLPHTDKMALGAHPKARKVAGSVPVTPGGFETFFAASTNMVDPATFTAGTIISTGQGATSVNAAYSVSDWIPVAPGERYTVGGTQFLRFTAYDGSQNYLATHNFPAYNGTPQTYTVPPSGAWIRVSIFTGNLPPAMMNPGETLLPHEPYGITLNPSMLPTSIPPLLPILDDDLSGIWTAAEPLPSAAGTIPSSTVNDVYSAYDALAAANPGYVAKTQIGTDPSPDGIPLYLYRFNQPSPAKSSGFGSLVPRVKVVLTSGTHGERAAIWTAVNFAKALCDDWAGDPVIAALRYNVDLLVIPLANPYGYAGAQRSNYRDVDMARNWPTGWVQGVLAPPTSTNYGGTAPLSEPETLAVKSVLDAHPDAHVIDFHNFLAPANDYNFLWGLPGNKRSAEVSEAVIRRMDRTWKKSQPIIVKQDPMSYIGFVSTAPGGSLGVEAAARGHRIGMVFEICNKIPPQSTSTGYDSLAMTWGLEALVNLMMITARA